MGTSYVVGLDLGKEIDYTAWCVMEQRQLIWSKSLSQYSLDLSVYDKDADLTRKPQEELGLIGLNQIPLHTPWGTIANELNGLITRCFQKEQRAKVYVWVDASGIGDPVIDGFFKPVIAEHSKCTLVPVRIVPGEEGYSWTARTVSKIHLIDNALVMREQKQFAIAGDLRDKPVMELFEQQIQDFRRKEGKRAGTIRYEAREGEHDDLVIAFALVCLGVKESGHFDVYCTSRSFTAEDLGIR